MLTEKSRQRLDALFSDIKRLTADPASDTPAIRRELDELRARLCELEAQFLESEKRAAEQESAPPLEVVEAESSEERARPVAPILYEKEHVGYVYTDDRVKSLQHVSPPLPEATDTIIAPLTASGQTIGKMQIEPAPERPWTNEEASLLNAVAQQASLQIQNLRLLAEAEQSRAEAESATRRFMHENWESYLDAIHHSERVGYAYDRSAVTPYTEPACADGGFLESVQVMDEQVGTLYLKPDPARPWTNDDKELVSTVARQIAQQVENLRLLADATRARAEAEQATRRLTREGWQSYTSQQDEAGLGFVYDSNQVTPLGDSPVAQDVTFAQPLQVRGETIGQLAVAGWKDISPEAIQLSTAVAAQVSTHLETLRLLRTTEYELAERIRTEQELLKVRLGMDRANDAVFMTDTNGTILYVNSAFERIYGWTKEEAIGQTPRIIKSGLIPPERYKEFWKTLLDSQVVAGEIVNKSKDGRLIPIEGSNNPIVDANGKIIGFLALHKDITERKQAQEIIAKHASQLEAVAALSTTASTLLDPDKLLQSVVDLTKERFGLYHAHIYLADTSWNTLLLAAGAGEVGRQMVAEGWNIPLDHEQSIVARAARTHQSVIANDVIRDKTSPFLSNQLLADTRSEMAIPMIVGQKLLGVFDVQANTVDYFSEEDANIYTILAAQVAVALQNARLYVEQSATVTQLRELDKLKSSFLANMSHELRTPLNSILGFADVMLEGLDGQLTDYMDNDLRLIQKNGQHLLHLINDVLDMAKIESGRMNLNPEKFKVHEILDEVISITSTLASEKNLSLFIDENSDHDIEIYADNTRLRQVMINLVNNSIKFTEMGKIKLCAAPMDGARVLISVKDTGIGIPPDKLEAVFQEFTQVDASTTRKAGGTGLGLPISRRLVDMHGGRLWAESSGIPGEGSTFFVELPIEARITEVIEKQEK
jgi:PAS domain S-box-containing protein